MWRQASRLRLATGSSRAGTMANSQLCSGRWRTGSVSGSWSEMEIERAIPIPEPSAGGPLRDISRDEEMVRLHVEERMTLSDIGGRYGVSRERVRQVVRRNDVPPEVTREVTRENMTVEEVEWRCEHCGKMSRDKPSIAKRRTYCSKECWGAAKIVWTEERLLDHLRELSEIHGHTPGENDINEVAPPYHMDYFRRFGSLREAQRLAGLEPNDPGAPGHHT